MGSAAWRGNVGFSSGAKVDPASEASGGHGGGRSFDYFAGPRIITKSILKNCGYKYLVSENGRQALDIYKKHREEIDLVILDVVMPGMGGLQCYRQLQNINPQIRVLIITGFPNDRSTRKLLKEGAAAVIEKPFALDHFTRQIHLLIES